VQQGFRIIEIHLDLFEDDLALFGHVAGIEKRAQAEVGNNIEGNGQMVIENFGAEANLFFGSEASNMPPTESISRAMDSAERRSVPLKTMCSMKCASPFCSVDSRREPVRIQTPTETERTWRMVSVTTTRPLGRTWRWMSRCSATIVFAAADWPAPRL